ncbi:hypothetical protein AB0C93_35925 [Streptomyces sp. NPDC048518]|uniref:hypothetical protein n=1 Tax=Streptomyces sp. NPDC048518 TaxID=3155029 RepID=UPI0033D4F4C6
MTQTPSPSPPVPASPAPMTQTSSPSPHAVPGPRGRVPRTVVGIACAPYLALKVAWICGSRLGIPDGSPLLDDRALMICANGLTVLMDLAVIVLAALLTRPWGLRTPARLLVPPMWAASGLLLPIVAGFPLTLLVGALSGDATADDSAADPFLRPWVFGVVYGGFIVQALALGTLFVRYARDRWGHLWRGRVGDLPPAPGRCPRAAAVAAGLLALGTVAVHLLWATGSTAGLNTARIQGRSGDFYALEFLNALYPALAAAGALLLVFRWGRALPVGVPLAFAWLGSGAVACWGGWLLLGSLTTLGDAAGRPTGPMYLTYAVHMITGTVVAALGVRFLKERAGPTP